MSAAGFEIVTTSEGVYALRDLGSGEVMHPGQGPLYEAHALYVAPSRLELRLMEAVREPLVLFDVGLGASSNALCALHAVERMARPLRRLEIVSFDLHCDAMRYALESEQRASFGFTPALQEAARALLDQQSYEGARASWRLVLGDARESLKSVPASSVDIAFWDPYSPRANPDMWSESAFSLLRRVCREGATVHTYSAATATRSALLLSGFYVGLGPASGAKQKHATLAATRLADLTRPLDRGWLTSFPRPRLGIAAEAALSAEARARLEHLPQFAR